MDDDNEYLNDIMHGGGDSDSDDDDDDDDDDSDENDERLLTLARGGGAFASLLGGADDEGDGTASTSSAEEEDGEEESTTAAHNVDTNIDNTNDNGWTWGTGGGGGGGGGLANSRFQAKAKKTILLPGEKKKLKKRHMAEVRAARSEARVGKGLASMRIAFIHPFIHSCIRALPSEGFHKALHRRYTQHTRVGWSICWIRMAQTMERMSWRDKNRTSELRL